MKHFSVYTLFGVANTLCHWAVFVFVLPFFDVQAVANLVAFAVAATLSYFLNSRWTFRRATSGLRYLLWLFVMGVLSFSTGAASDRMDVHPVLTLILTSSLSLVLGFFVAKHVVFRESRST